MTCTYHRRIVVKIFSPQNRLAELELEEEIIRERYMYGAPLVQAMIIAERLNEICSERELIMGLLVQQQEPEPQDPS